jgi:uncharacterized protein YggE
METSRYIETVGSCRYDPPVETYRAMIEISVTVRRRRSALDESLALRNRVIEAVKSAGVSPNCIEEAGGSISRNYWSKKRVSHSLLISAADIAVLTAAMALVEPVCSASNHDFSFHLVSPVFAKTDDVRERVLQQAVANARRKAEVLAHEAGVELAGVLTIVEMADIERRSPNAWPTNLPSQESELRERFVACLDCSDSLFDRPPYTTTAPAQSPRHAQCRVRFSVADPSPGSPPAPLPPKPAAPPVAPATTS